MPFDPGLFDYGRTGLDTKKLQGVGFNGFRVHYAVNKPGYKDEVSCSRAQATSGPSARAALRPVGARPGRRHRDRRGREFPRFVEFWVERPRAGAASLTIYALLDSRRIAGAYRFVLTPGVETQMQVTARLFARERIAKLGIAPLTSMYTFGRETSRVATTSAPKCTTPTACRCSRARASGSGGRSSIRGASSSRRLR